MSKQWETSCPNSFDGKHAPMWYDGEGCPWCGAAACPVCAGSDSGCDIDRCPLRDNDEHGALAEMRAAVEDGDE